MGGTGGCCFFVFLFELNRLKPKAPVIIFPAEKLKDGWLKGREFNALWWLAKRRLQGI